MPLAIMSCLMLLMALLQPVCSKAQDSLRTSETDSLFASLRSSLSLSVPVDVSFLKNDSMFRSKMKSLISPIDTGGLKSGLKEVTAMPMSFSNKPFFGFDGGYVSYNYTDQSAEDSAFLGYNVAQHLITTGLNFTIAQTLPIRVTYFERQTNSPYFKDFRDVRVDVDVQRYRQLKLKKALAGIPNLTGMAKISNLEQTLNDSRTKLSKFNNLITDPQLASRLIQAKETLIRTDYSDTSVAYIDSVRHQAASFIKFYDAIQSLRNQYQQKTDSLVQLYQQVDKIRREVLQLSNRRSVTPEEIAKVATLAGQDNKLVRQLRGVYEGIRSFSIGRTLPNFTPLTVQNVNVKGINFEYTKERIYLAVAAGLVDFRIRDFLYSKEKPVTQYLYAARVGYGSKERDNIIVSYFRGRKQLFGSAISNKGTEIQGVSVAGQFFIQKSLRVYGEIAQSGVPSFEPGHENNSTINVNDDSQRAWLVGLSGYFPATNTSFEGHYQHSGLNYQSFNSFQYNAAVNSWTFRLDQSFLKRQLNLQVGFRKNDFNNPQILQRYNSNTVYKNVLLSFRRSKWPTVTLGYLPSSQYTAVGNTVYENHYQTFTGNANYQYSLGISKAATTVAMSRFFNDNRDTGMIYYNARNLFIGQTFTFSLFTASINVSQTYNAQYKLVVMEEGLSAVLFRKVNAGFTVKINNLDRLITKVGFTAKTGFPVWKLGDFNLWMDQNYLPSFSGGLYQYRMYNLGFVKYF